MLRCAECGDLIPEGMQQKRTIYSGSSFSWWHGRVDHLEGAFVCPRCAAAYDRAGCWVMGCAGAFVLGSAAAIVALVVWVARHNG